MKRKCLHLRKRETEAENKSEGSGNFGKGEKTFDGTASAQDREWLT